MKASIDTTTGLLIESQSAADAETMIRNAANLGFGSVEIREVTDDELRMLISARDAMGYVPDPKKETSEVSLKMISSGIFKPVLVMLNDYYLTKIKALPAASGMTDEQIIEALSNTASPYYEPDFVKVKTYFSDLMSI